MKYLYQFEHNEDEILDDHLDSDNFSSGSLSYDDDEDSPTNTSAKENAGATSATIVISEPPISPDSYSSGGTYDYEKFFDEFQKRWTFYYLN